jgi:hypothetical protein
MDKKTAVVILCLCLFCFVLCPFAHSGDIRTYVGTNDTIEEEKDKQVPPEPPVPVLPKAEQEDEDMAGSEEITDKEQTDETEQIRQFPPQLLVPESPVENVTTQEDGGASNIPQINNETQTVQQKIPESEIEIISHDHIPLGGGYHMIGEPDNPKQGKDE